MSETENKVESKSASDETKPEQRQRTESEGNESNPDIHFDPIIQLPLIDVKTLEENETELLKLRAKLYRYDTSEEVPQFKERGTGEVRIMKHRNMSAVRILMRRDKTLKLCANHYIMPSMELKKHNNSDKVFVWSTFADLSDETPTPETLAIRFGNAENAQKFKEVFDESKQYVSENLENNFNKLNINSNENEDKNSEDSGSESDDQSDQQSDEDKNEVKSEDKTKEKSEENESKSDEK